MRAETFAIALGDTITDGVPAAGAGRIASAKDDDIYTFSATAGQLAFFEPISQDDAFKRNLRWKLTKPSGLTVFGSFFSNPIGRTLLNETGTYQIRVYSDGTDPSWVGAYSFRTTPIPPDQSFSFAIGGQVSDGVPAAGAGRLEVAGTEDSYQFTANAGQLVFFDSLSQEPTLKNSLRWQLIRPSGTTIFSSFFANPQGRMLLNEAGVYRIRIFTDGVDPAMFGGYSFKVTAIPPDQTFAYTVGTTVSDGVPEAGAGRLEVAGSEDNYLFTATAGQVVFFESLSQDAAYKSNLRWQLYKPSGGTVFSSFFTNPQGRVVLAEAGQYRLRLFTDNVDPRYFGAYSFKTRADVADQQFTLKIGDVVSDGKPAAGEGNIETPGSTDTYSFNGRAGQFVIFESLTQAPSLQNQLRWQLIKPSGGNVFSSFFANKQGRTQLPEAGVYKLRIFTDPGLTLNGAYSFRTYSPVTANPDNLQIRPNQPLTVPLAKLLFNDTGEDDQDVLSIELLSSTTSQGGSLALGAGGLTYTPKSGFLGVDHFDYRLRGALGGTNQTTVTVEILSDGGKYAGVVNWVTDNVGLFDISLMGDPGVEYVVETSVDLETWTPIGSLTPPASRFTQYSFPPSAQIPQKYLRARRK